MNVGNQLPIMLLEPNALMRKTVALTAISIEIGSVQQVASVMAAKELLGTQALSGAVIAIDLNDKTSNNALSLIEAIRAGTTASSTDIPVHVLVDACDQTLLTRLAGLQIQRILIKPFKARVLIESLSTIFSSVSANASRAMRSSVPV